MSLQNLPYASELEGEAKRLLDEITENLCAASKAKDWGPGVAFWVKQLNGYLDLQHPLAREIRAQLARLLYELVVTPGIDYAQVEMYANACVRLIKKKEKINQEDLTLPWEPLFDIIYQTFFPKSRQKTLPSQSKQIGSVVRLVDHAQRFFPPDSTSAILQRILPLYNANSAGDTMAAQAFLIHFLPTIPPPSSSLSPTSNTPSSWLPSIFTLWSLVPGSMLFQTELVDLLARVAEDNVHVEMNDPEYIGVFTKSQIKNVFAIGAKLMDLPVGSSITGNNARDRTSTGGWFSKLDMRAGSALLLKKKGDRFKMFAKFIVYTIFPSNGIPAEETSLGHLMNMIQATESFYHPSNFGRWTFSMVRFLQSLGYEFLRRWKEEQKTTCKTPKHLRLTADLKSDFVTTLRSVTFLSMFGKDQSSVSASHAALKYLAWLEPSIILPGLLERAYPSLESLTETHRTTSCISALSLCSPALFSRAHYPAGGKHLAPLLHLVLPGVDMNDPLKTISSLLFITHSIIGVPLIDVTEGNGDGNNAPRWTGMDIDEGDDNGMELDEGEEDGLARAGTAEFEDWVAKFLRRVFTIFEYFPQQASGKMNSYNLDTGLISVLLHACEVVGFQLSEHLQDIALKMIVDFATSTILQNAIKPMGHLCAAVTSPNRRKGLAKFIPICRTNILIELQHGASSTPTVSSSHQIQSDTRFHWYQCILYNVVMFSGPELLDHKKELIELGQEMVGKCRSRRGYMWAGKFVRQMLGALTGIYPNECRNVDQETWLSDEYRQNHYKYWGKPGDSHDVKIDWHVPSDAEKDFALELLDVFLKPSITRLKELMATGTDEEGKPLGTREMSNEFCRHLSIVRNCLAGTNTMVYDDGDSSLSEFSDDETASVRPLKKLYSGYCFVDPKDARTHTARQLRRQLGEFLHELATYFRTNRENDIESLKILLKAIKLYLTNRGVDKSKYDASRRGYNYQKDILKVSHHDKSYPRYLLVKRVYQRHLCRLKQNAFNRPRTRLHDHLLGDLTELSLSLYSEIRRIAQAYLSNASRCFIGAKPLIIPKLLSALEAGENAHPDRMKGALYLLNSRTYMHTCLRDWRFVPSFIMHICQAQHEDKPSVQELIRRVFYDYLINYGNTAFQVELTEGLNNAIDTLLKTSSVTINENRYRDIQEKVERKMTLQKKNYFELVGALLELVNSNTLHWRFTLMVTNFLDVLIRPEAGVKPELADFLVKSLVSELPSLRRIAIIATTKILLYMKQRAYHQGEIELLPLNDRKHPLKKMVTTPRPLPNGFVTDYLTTGLIPIAKSKTENIVFQEKNSIGWLLWPTSFTGYIPRTSSITLFPIDAESSATYSSMLTHFTSAKFWKELSVYMSQELARDKDDVFSTVNANLFKSIFQIYDDQALDVLKPEVNALCSASEEKNKQRAAAEMLAGLVRGSKHWEVEKLDALWAWLIPLLEKTFNAITPDSLIYWDKFLGYCLRNRDPRRVYPLIELVLQSHFDPTSHASFNEAKKLYFINTVINSFSWRITPQSMSLVETFTANVRHPYKQVRDVMAANINLLLQIQWYPSYGDLETLLKSHREVSGGVGYVPTTCNARVEEILDNLVKALAEWRAIKTPTATGSSEYGNASKTVLAWLYESLCGFQATGTYPFIVPLLPEIFQMQDINDDQDLQNMATHVLNQIASFTYPTAIVHQMIDKFVEILTESPSWHVRVKALPVIQVFYFKHLFTLTKAEMIKVMDVVSGMLMDMQIEVRQLAAVTLAGLIRCSQRDAITTLEQRFTELINVKIPSRKRTDKPLNAVIVPGFAEAVLKRHAAVLGLSCLVDAFPYEIPKWMPDVLVKLAGCISDPAPIQTTVKKTFADFRRTHQDTWHEDKKQFTDNQLSILSDLLISPSYYA